MHTRYMHVEHYNTVARMSFTVVFFDQWNKSKYLRKASILFTIIVSLLLCVLSLSYVEIQTWRQGLFTCDELIGVLSCSRLAT